MTLATLTVNFSPSARRSKRDKTMPWIESGRPKSEALKDASSLRYHSPSVLTMQLARNKDSKICSASSHWTPWRRSTWFNCSASRRLVTNSSVKNGFPWAWD